MHSLIEGWIEDDGHDNRLSYRERAAWDKGGLLYLWEPSLLAMEAWQATHISLMSPDQTVGVSLLAIAA
jgi:hypothetical protein